MIKKILIIACMAIGLSGCSYEAINAGQEGVVVKKPMFFGSSGVEPKGIQTGAIWVMPTTTVYRYDIKARKRTETFVDLTTSDNVAIDFDVFLTLRIHSGYAPILHERLGLKWYDQAIKDTFRAYVRNMARNHNSLDLRTSEKQITGAQEELKRKMNKYMDDNAFLIEVVKVNIGKVVPPEAVLAESARTAAQKQRKQTEIERKIAEDSRRAAEQAAAIADQAYSKEFDMTTEQFLRNKELDIFAIAVKEGQTTLILNAANAQPIMNVMK